MLSPKWATRLFIAAIVGATISMGLFFNVTGPTLPTLAANCGTSVKTLSWIFTVRAGIHESIARTRLFFNPESGSLMHQNYSLCIPVKGGRSVHWSGDGDKNIQNY